MLSQNQIVEPQLFQQKKLKGAILTYTKKLIKKVPDAVIRITPVKRSIPLIEIVELSKPEY